MGLKTLCMFFFFFFFGEGGGGGSVANIISSGVLHTL